MDDNHQDAATSVAPFNEGVCSTDSGLLNEAHESIEQGVDQNELNAQSVQDVQDILDEPNIPHEIETNKSQAEETAELKLERDRTIKEDGEEGHEETDSDEELDESGDELEEEADLPQASQDKAINASTSSSGLDSEQESDSEYSDSSEEEEEPQLKYSRISSLPTSLHNDAVSCFLVQKNFRAFATHAGTIYLMSSENKLIRTYRAHRASILSLSSDGIYLASASIDGTVVIGSVLESNDIIAADFQRPVHAVALDPNYRTSKSYISGGMAGRVVYSERNWLGKRVDSYIDDNGSGGDNGSICGIFWLPNNIVLWMNDIGITIFSMTKRKQICVVNLPEGAPRADLYRPRICMAESDLVYVAWGQYIWSIRFTTLGANSTLTSEKALAGGAAGMALLSSSNSIKSFGLVEEKATVESWRKVPWLICGIANYGDDKLLLLCYFGPREGDRLVTDAPELKIVDWRSGEELYADVVMVKGFERLGMNDYQMLSSVDFTIRNMESSSQKSLQDEVSWVPNWFGSGSNNGTSNTSNASVHSGTTSIHNGNTSTSNATETTVNNTLRAQNLHPNESANYYIVSAHDTIIASKRDVYDHYNWLLEHQQIKNAWDMSLNLVDPEERKALGLRLVSQLVSQELWDEAADFLRDVLQAYGKHVSPSKVAADWDSWCWQFIQADKHEYLAPVVPEDPEIACKMDVNIYNEIIGYHLEHQLYQKLSLLLREWPVEVYDVEAIKSKIEQIIQDEQDSLEPPKTTSDCDRLEYLLSQLYIATNELYPAVQHLLHLHHPGVLDLIEEHHLLPLFIPAIPDILTVELGTKNELELIPIDHIRKKTRRAVKLAVSLRHEVLPDKVVSELLDADTNMDVILYLYLEELNSQDSYASQTFADLLVKLYAKFDRPKLIGFLKRNNNYDLGAAVEICEKLDYVSELVYLLGKVGQNKRALKLITEKLGDPEQAIEFAKYQNDRELWTDLVEYSKNRPNFIQALLQRHYLLSKDDSTKLVTELPMDLDVPELKQLLLEFFSDNEMTLSLTEGALNIMQNEARTYSEQLRTLRLRGEVVDLENESDVRFQKVDLTKSVLLTPDDKVVNEAELIGEKAWKTVEIKPGWTISWKLSHLAYILKNLKLGT